MLSLVVVLTGREIAATFRSGHVAVDPLSLWLVILVVGLYLLYRNLSYRKSANPTS